MAKYQHKSWKHFDGDMKSGSWFYYDEQKWSWTPTVAISIGFILLFAAVLIFG